MWVIIIRKKFLLISLIAVILLFLTITVTTPNFSRVVTNTSKLQKVVVIDAGHGSVDPGAVYNGLEEKTINLQVAYILKDLLEEANIKVVMTRTDDSLYNKSRHDDIIYRARKTNEVKADAFVSIHVNKFPTSEPFGGQAYYYSGEVSKNLAEKIQEQLKVIQPDNYRSIGKGNYYVLKKTNCPAVLVEIGFISNPIDRQRLTNAQEQRRIAEAIRTGLITFFNERLDQPGNRIVFPRGQQNQPVANIPEGINLYFGQNRPIESPLVSVNLPIPASLRVNSAQLTYQEQVAVEAVLELIAGPTDSTLTPVLPPGTELLGISVRNDTVILNFNRAFIDNHWGGASGEQMTLEAITKTLTSLPGIKQVSIFVEGAPLDTIAGHIILENPLTWDTFE